MSNKDYRELQISSSQLVIIFLAIIVLGVIIFLLGISVGKKQSEILLASQMKGEMAAEPITQEKVLPLEKPEEKVVSEDSAEETKSPAPAAPTEKRPQNLNWFIQVGAFRSSEGAQSVADQFREEGHSAVVLNPNSSERSGLYRVRIGGYATREIAENAKAQMVKKDPKASEYLIIQQR